MHLKEWNLKSEWVLTDRQKDGCHYAELPWQPYDEECVDKPYTVQGCYIPLLYILFSSAQPF